MNKSNPFLKTELRYFLHTFKRQPLLLTKARGTYVWDHRGRRYLDFFSGISVCSVGHAHPNVVAAIQRQSNALLHVSNYFYTQPQMELAAALTKRIPGSRVFLSNSGAEANEMAIKLARLWASKNKKAGREIVVFSNAFHGRTIATLTATDGSTAMKKIFGPLPSGFRRAPYNDIAALKKIIGKRTIAVLVEPVQGEGGIHIATRGFMKTLSDLSRRHRFLIIVDEIQSGLGRSGRFLACDWFGVKPDIVTLAKGLAGGLPLGATLAAPAVSKHIAPGMHGSTFGGNPVACAAALEVLKMLTPNALRHIHRQGQYLSQRLSAFQRFPSVKSTRGMGLLQAVELNAEGAPYVERAREKGLLINCTRENVLRFLPPYFMTRKEMNRALDILESVFEDLN